MSRLGPDKPFQPKITTGVVNDNAVWLWHLPDGKTPAHGVVVNRPIEECKAEYVKFLESYHGVTVKPGDVEVILPKAAVNGHPAIKPSSNKPVGAKAPDRPAVYYPNPKAKVLSVPRIKTTEQATPKPEETKQAAAEPMDIPPITLEPIEPLALAVPLPVIEVGPEPPKEEPVLVQGKTSDMPRCAPFFNGSRKNPYYEEIVFAALMNWDEPAGISEAQWDRRMEDSLEILQEVVPKAGDWNRASVDADEIVKQWLPCVRNFALNEDERRKLWEIVQGRIYKILTEQRAQRESEVKAARRK
jgi:hypothetical protein